MRIFDCESCSYWAKISNDMQFQTRRRFSFVRTSLSPWILQKSIRNKYAHIWKHIFLTNSFQLAFLVARRLSDGGSTVLLHTLPSFIDIIMTQGRLVSRRISAGNKHFCSTSFFLLSDDWAALDLGNGNINLVKGHTSRLVQLIFACKQI